MKQIKVDKSLIKIKGQIGPHSSHQFRSFEKHLTRFYSSLRNTSTGTIELRLTHKISSLRTRGVRLVLPAIRWHVNKLAVMTLQFVRTAEVHVEPESRSDSGRRLCCSHMWRARDEIGVRCGHRTGIHTWLICIRTRLPQVFPQLARAIRRDCVISRCLEERFDPRDRRESHFVDILLRMWLACTVKRSGYGYGWTGFVAKPFLTHSNDIFNYNLTRSDR